MSCRAVYAVQAKPLEKATFGYDFRETSSSSHQQVVKKVKKSDISATFDHQGTHHATPSPNQFEYMQLHSSRLSMHCHQLESASTAAMCAGVYLCIKAYGEVNLTYSLRATLSDCPADFTATGQQLLCSSPLNGDASQQRYTECAPDGTCVCKAPYDKPVDDVYPCEPSPRPTLHPQEATFCCDRYPACFQGAALSLSPGCRFMSALQPPLALAARMYPSRQAPCIGCIREVEADLSANVCVQCWALRTARPRQWL